MGTPGAVIASEEPGERSPGIRSVASDHSGSARRYPGSRLLRSERPGFDAHYPHIAQRGHQEKYISFTGKTLAEHEAPGAPSERSRTSTRRSACGRKAADPTNPSSPSPRSPPPPAPVNRRSWQPSARSS